jgi:hypothetical protein
MASNNVSDSFKHRTRNLYVFGLFNEYCRCPVVDDSPLNETVKLEHIRNHMTEMCKIPPFIFDLSRNETGFACLRSSFSSKRPNLSSEALRDERFKDDNSNAFYSSPDSRSPSQFMK